MSSRNSGLSYADLTTSSENEPGTLDYDWYFNADNTVCHTYERYRDSTAVVAHGTTFRTLFVDRFLQACRQTGLDVYGSPNEAAQTVLAAYNPTYFAWKSGFSR